MFIMADRIRGSTLFNSASAWPSPVADAQDIAGRLRDRSQDGQEGGHTGGSGLEMAGPVVSDTNGPGQHGDGGSTCAWRYQCGRLPGDGRGEGRPEPTREPRRSGSARDGGAVAGPAGARLQGRQPGEPTGSQFRPLNEVAAHFLPPSSPAQPTADGSICSTDIPNTNQPSVKRKLNPIFVEALMRWPTGLSGFERQAMGWILWQQRMLTYLSMLCSRAEPAQPDLFGAAA
jgi:hypothetical protein